MKNNKKILTLALAATLSLCAVFAASACAIRSEKDSSSDDAQSVDYKVAESNEELVVLTVTHAVMPLTDATSLFDYMQKLQEKGKLTFEVADGFITKVNGVENPADYSSCWMMYTDLGVLDGVSYSNAEWGTYTYGEKTYNSAAYGVTALPAVEGYTYILHYDAF